GSFRKICGSQEGAQQSMMSPAMAPRKPHSEEMLSLLERHKIQVLLEAAFGPADVAERTGVSIDMVQRVQRESVDGQREARKSEQAGWACNLM
ncbi:MAG TPA: hypothetical protein VFN67_36230, partial [Polyangiales bacterium]|nr:hypothetical protein [Polyangiales bacterium]